MAVPRRKTSPSRRGMRRSADALKKPTYAEDKDSGELRRPHHLDLKTGMYKGRQVLKAKKDPEPDYAGSSRACSRCSTAPWHAPRCDAYPHRSQDISRLPEFGQRVR